ncbi:MAG: ATP-binding protein [Pseudomonadota bacterium]
MKKNSKSTTIGADRATKSSPSRDHQAPDLTAKVEAYKKTLTEIYELYGKKIEELSLIRKLGDYIRTPFDLESLCLGIVEVVSQEISADRHMLMLLNQDRGRLAVRASFDAAWEEARFFSESTSPAVPLDRGEAARAAASGRPVVLPAAVWEEDPLLDRPGPPAALLFLPLVARDKAVGVFFLSRAASQPFLEDEVRILTIISDQAAAALANVQLFNDLAAANIRLSESEREARRTSLYLENMLETANDVIFTLDFQGAITYVNKKVGEWGYDKDRLLGLQFTTLLADPSSGASPSGGFPFSGKQLVEVGLLTASGDRRDVLLSASDMDSGTEQGRTELVMARDITGRKQLEKQLFHSEKLASIGILAAGVAHEIGNPLSAISGYTQILQSGVSDPEEAREYLGAIESQAARIQRIIEDLLSYSRPGTGVVSEIDLGESIRSIMSILAAQSAFKNMEVEYRFGSERFPVNMDRDHLAQIIINIALNASQAMPGGGCLHIGLSREGEQAVILLEDNGPGIPDNIKNKIFDPFFTTKPVGQGTGLGLSICFRIVESYNGTIGLETGTAGGAAFLVRLPLAPAGN